MERLLYRLAFGCAVAGLGILLVVMVSGKAWPDPIYAIGAPLGMGFIALCLVFLAARWAVRFWGAVRARQLWQIAALALAAVVCLAGFFLRR
ncbi:hypothetical protein B5G38_06190 [Gemmiger sp. An87]|nr:hypothetical protein B5G38_06190 [Gemmiger sp. An87]